MSEILECGHPESPHGEFTRGYGRDSEGNRHCYDCCAAKDMRYQVAPTGSRVRPWAVVDSERPDDPCVSRHMTATEALAARDRLNLEAAAPDLLAALERWERFACDNGWSEQDAPWLAETRTAIAKARGQ